MKLKKIASLALAGVMAVSMLAGCAGKNNTNEGTTETSSITADAVIAKLAEATTKNVTFKASAALQATADEAAKYVETDKVYDGGFDAELLRKLDEKLPTANELAKVDKKSSATDKVEQKSLFVLKTDNTVYGANDAAVLNKLVSLVDSYNNVEWGYKGWSALPTKSTAEFTDTVYAGKFVCNLTYTAEMAVTSVANDNGQLTYYVVVAVTRTPEPVKKA